MPVWLTPFVMPVVAFALAAYGWHLITQLAKRREAHDLYGSVLALLEQLDADGRGCVGPAAAARWMDTPSKNSCRKSWPSSSASASSTSITTRPTRMEFANNQLSILRDYLTAYPLKNSPEKSRTVAIHALIADMVGNLLEENYAYINQSPWMPAAERPANRPPSAGAVGISRCRRRRAVGGGVCHLRAGQHRAGVFRRAAAGD